MTSNRPKPAKPSGARAGLRAGVARILGAGRSGSHRVLLTATVACLCLVAAGVSVAVFSSPSGSQVRRIADAGSSPAPAATQAPAKPKAPAAPKAPTASGHGTHGATGPKVTSDGNAKAAPRWSPRLKREIARWAKGPGGRALAAVTAQLGVAMQTAGLKLYTTMKQACVALAASAGTARAGPPIPDAAMQHLYAKALTGIAADAAGCEHAISIRPGGETTQVGLNRPLLARTRLLFAAMSAELYRATGQIRPLLR